MKKIKLIFMLLFFCSIKINAQILFSETFSTSLGQCSTSNSVSGNWVFANSCTSSSLTGHSANGHALFQGSSCQFGNGSNTVSGNLNTSTIAIGPNGAVLTFNYMLLNECSSFASTCSYDILSLQISNNGGSTFTTIMASNGSPAGLVTNNTGWTAVTYSLNSYANQTIIIRFNFNSVDGIGNNYDGVYVDDIIVTGNCFINLTSSPSNSTVSPIICAGNSITLTTNAVSNYSWSNGATTPSIVVSPASATMYSVVATSSANCSTSASLSVQVNGSIPTLSLVNTASATAGTCPNASVSLTASGANTYTWSGGTGSVTNGVAFVPTTAGNYTVVGGNACGTSSAAVSLSIHPIPTVTATASTASLCSGTSVTLTGIGTATSFGWFGGSGGITNGAAYYPAVSATYTVIGTGAKNCTVSATIPVAVVTTPSVPPTSNPGLICIGNSSTLNASGATNYTWSSATQTVNTASFIVTPAVGVTSYTVRRSNANCISVQSISVTTNSLPTIFAIVTPTLVCALNPATLAVGGGQTYTWTSPGPPSFSFTGASPIVSPPVSTTYTVAASDGTCINTTTVFLATNPNPTITTSATTPSVCNGQTVGLSANGAINYTWTANTGTFFTQSITETPSLATSYLVMGDNIYGCTSAANQIVLVYPNPTITISASKTLVCNGGTSTLTASGANSYTWDPGANNALTPVTIVTATNITSGPVPFMVQGSYATGCTSNKIILVSVFIPTLTITGNTNTCYGGLINLTAGGGNNNTYSWNTGVGNPYNFGSISTTLAASATWTLSAMTTSASVICPSSKIVILGIYFNPTITAVAQRTLICKSESVNLYGNGGVSYVWNNNVTGGTITVNPNANINYTVTGTDANGCVNTGTVQVKVSICSGIQELSVLNSGLSVYPNPNTGEFTIASVSDITLTLVNELGQIVRTIIISGSNDHEVSVTDLPKGIYFISGQNNAVQIYQKVIVTK